MPDEGGTLPLKWRPRVPDGRSAGSIFQFIREYLVQHGGTCTRNQLLQAVRSQAELAARLDHGQGFERLLQNMRHSGFITISGDTVTASARTLRRTLNRP